MTPQDKSAPNFDKVDRALEMQVFDWLQWREFEMDDGRLATLALQLIAKRKAANEALQAECERLKAAVEEVEGRRDELIQDLRDHSTWWKQTREERDQWKQMAEEMAGALNEGLRYFEKTYKYANDNADTYDREWAAAHPGVFSGFFQNFWRASEQHILMCMSGFKVKRAELLAKFAKLKEQMK